MGNENLVKVDCSLCGGTGKLFSSSSIGTDLATFRAKNSVSRDKFSKMCGLSVLTIFNIEKGKTKPQQMSEQKIRAAIDSYKPKEVASVIQSQEETAIEQQPASREAVSESGTEPTRRVFYQAEDDDDWAEEIETEDGE